MQTATNLAIDLTENGLIPDRFVRAGIRRLLRERLDEIRGDDIEAAADRVAGFVAAMDRAAIAPLPHKANEQHYEVPAEFFAGVLGGHRKYSCCHWDAGCRDLDAAEAEALRLTCIHAGIEDGMRILELGCGWGSLTLWLAAQYPGSRITAVSNSQSQRAFIEQAARTRRLDNLEVITADMNDFATAARFDRVVSVEMFEHMRNYRALFARVHDWLVPGGRFLMHIFCHRSTPYAFTEAGPGDWMSRHFFSGGMMPSDALPLHFQERLRFVRQWRWNGRHYARTANAWLDNMDARRDALFPILQRVYGERAAQWWQRWRVFFMACAELFAYDGGREWYVGHYLFERPDAC